MMPSLSPKRRVLAAMLGGPVDRLPVGNVVSVATVELMEAAGVWFPRAHLDAAEMAHLAAAGHTVLRYDTVMPVFSVVQEAAALGCEITWGDSTTMPAARTHPFASTERPVVPEGWMDAASIQVLLDALSQLRKELGSRVVIVGKVMGPWSLSYHLMGVENFLLNTILDPDRVCGSLGALKEVTVAFAKAQIEAGADIICMADHATGDMVSPKMYWDILLPIHQEIVAEVGCPMVLHCCGNTSDRLQYFSQAGFDSFHFESKVDLERAVAVVAGKMTLMGNINNPELLLCGTPDQVNAACQSVITAGVQILAPECAVPLTTPTANLKAAVAAANANRAAGL